MKSWKIAIVALMMGGMLMPVAVYGAEAADAVEDHLALAASYEEKAAVQDTLIGEHTRMKADYKDRFFVNEKLTPLNKIREMENHCNAIIAAASAEKGQLLDMAKWHRMRASELQGL